MTVNWFMPPSINVKNKLRISLIERRQALSPDEVIDCSKKVNEFCFNYLELNHHQNILTYLQINNEINTEKLIVFMLKKGLNIFLAKQEVGNVNQVFIKKVKKDNSGAKSFVVENTHYAMSLNYFDLVILPLVGVDSKGYRLGFGNGYFDKLLCNFKNNNPKKTIIGLGYAFQLTSENFAENHDLKFDTVFTELGGQHF